MKPAPLATRIAAQSPLFLSDEDERGDPVADVSELCQGCGMCCDGSLYTHVVLADGELLRLQNYPQLGITVRGDTAAFPLGCACHSASGCTIYEDRPAACSRYHCALAIDLLKGEVSLPEAQAIVQEGRELAANALSYLSLPPGQPLAITTWDEPVPGLPPEGTAAWESAKRWVDRQAHRLDPDPLAAEDQLSDSSSASS